MVPPSPLCSSTRVGFGEGFLRKEQCDNTGASLVSPDQAPADFYFFSRLKGRRFCDFTDINKNATKELKRLSENGFQDCFQHICSR
jgi:hypothetical protein